MIHHATLTNDNEDSGSMIEIESNLGTMVINEDDEDTMQRQGTSSANYRPEFLDHFDQKDKETDDDSNAQIPSNNKPPENTVPEADSPAGQAHRNNYNKLLEDNLCYKML